MTNRTSFKTRLVTSAMLVAMGCAIAAGATVYVDADAPGGGNGASWATALAYLQDALAVARDGNDIWVAEGTYKPDCNSVNPTGSGERTASFGLINGVEIYGGYAGLGEPDPNARDHNAYKTILSGDLAGDDGPDFANNGENSYHVVTGSDCNETAALDGFTITAGNGTYGGGLYNSTSSPTVANCTFSGNSAGQGGGICNYSGSSPTLTDCTFSGNEAGWGGGMHNYESSPTLINCTFSGNEAGVGGGMSNDYQSSSTLINCDFSGNSAGLDGGGMYNVYNNNPTLTNCAFSGNSAGRGGGMANDTDCEPELTNCLFSGNSAGSYGGGMLNVDYASPTLTNCTFGGNVSGYQGGGMHSATSNNSPTLTNCILWGNSDNDPLGTDESAQIHGGTVDIDYSCVQGWTGGLGGAGNTGSDPLFLDAAGGNYRLLPDSSCIDAADNTAVPPDTMDLDGDANTTEPIPFDLDGRPRFVDGDCNDTDIVDIGAYEFAYAYFGDFDNQCDVDLVDFSILADQWMQAPGQPSADIAPRGGDGMVDFFDLSVLCDHWLEGSGP